MNLLGSSRARASILALMGLVSLSDEAVGSLEEEPRGGLRGRLVEFASLPSVHSPDAYADASTRSWVTVSMHRSFADGAEQHVKLLRPASWVTENEAAEGEMLEIVTPDPTLSGVFQLDALAPLNEPIGAFEEGDSRMVTGTFVTENATVFTVTLDDGSQLTGTRQHPLFSLDRRGWVGLGEVFQGELLASDGGEAIVRSLVLEPEPTTVFNLEVQEQHMYLVGDEGLWSHNANECTPPSSGDSVVTTRRGNLFRRSRRSQRDGRSGQQAARAPAQVPNAPAQVPNAPAQVPNAPAQVPNAPAEVRNTGRGARRPNGESTERPPVDPEDFRNMLSNRPVHSRRNTGRAVGREPGGDSQRREAYLRQRGQGFEPAGRRRGPPSVQQVIRAQLNEAWNPTPVNRRRRPSRRDNQE